MSVPDHVRQTLRKRLWDLADEISWNNLSTTQKIKRYEEWTTDPTIGGILSRYIDSGKVRVYLKDTIMKDYARSVSADPTRPFFLLGLPPDQPVSQTYIKPHARRLPDGRVICWGRAGDWKLILMAVYERAAQLTTHKPYAAILTDANGKYAQATQRRIIEDAASKLGIERLIWA
jgi:hypothetical protein